MTDLPRKEERRERTQRVRLDAVKLAIEYHHTHDRHRTLEEVLDSAKEIVRFINT